MIITKHQKYCICIFIAASFLLLWKLDYAPYWNPDEGRYAAASLEMIAPFPGEQASWIIPHLNTLPRLNKPPLVYWVTAACYKIFGVHAWSGRLTSAIASIGVLALLWWMAIAIWGKGDGHKKAFLAMLVWVTAILPFALSRVLNTDMLLTFATTLILVAIWRTAEAKPSWRTFAAAAIGLALGLLAKGPVGLALPLLVVLVWLVIVRKKYFYRYFVEHRLGILLTFLVGIALAAPWYLAVNRERPGFLTHFIFYENLGRFSGEQEYHDPSPVYYFLPVILIGFFPWTCFLWTAAVNFWKQRSQDNRQTRARLFLWIWGLLIVVFFSASSTKLITYILPALPAFALLLSDAIAEYQLPSRVWRGAMKASIVLMAIIGLVLFALPHLTVALKLAPTSVLQSALTTCGGALLLGACAMACVYKSPRKQLLAQGIAALLFITLFPFAAGRIAPYEDMSPLFKRLHQHLQPDDQLVQLHTFQPTAIFYAKRPITVVDHPNTSGYNQQEYLQSPLFVPDAASLSTIMSASHRVFLLIKWADLTPELYLHYWGGNNDYALISNRPPPSGWPKEHVAPGKRAKIPYFNAHAK